MLNKVVQQQGREMVISQSVETFKLIGSGGGGGGGGLDSQVLVSLSSNEKIIPLNVDSPAARAVLYGQPVVSFLCFSPYL